MTKHDSETEIKLIIQRNNQTRNYLYGAPIIYSNQHYQKLQLQCNIWRCVGALGVFL